MEADWEVEIGGDAPVIDACWDGFVDLRLDPRTDSSPLPDTYLKRAQGLAESANLPGLSEALVQLNGLHSPAWTSKCDVWPILDTADIDADELDAPQEDATFAWACYIDLVPHNKSRPSPDATESPSPGFVTGHDWQVWASTQTHRANNANETGEALEVAEKLASDCLVTGHDFSRADANSLKGRGFSPAETAISENGALAPEGISTEAARLIDAAAQWCQQLRILPLTHCRADLIVRQAAIEPDQMDHGITAYLTACGRTSEEANATLARTLEAFANTLCPDSTVE